MCYLDTLLCQVPAGPVVELHHHQTVAEGLDGTVHPHDPAGALGRHVQVVGDGPGRHLQHVVRGALVQEDLTQRWEEGTRGTPGKLKGGMERGCGGRGEINICTGPKADLKPGTDKKDTMKAGFILGLKICLLYLRIKSKCRKFLGWGVERQPRQFMDVFFPTWE